MIKNIELAKINSTFVRTIELAQLRFESPLHFFKKNPTPLM